MRAKDEKRTSTRVKTKRKNVNVNVDVSRNDVNVKSESTSVVGRHLLHDPSDKTRGVTTNKYGNMEIKQS